MRLVTLALLLLPAVADAGLVKVIADLQACPGGAVFCQNQPSYGSGVCVGYHKGKSIVLTAGHIFQGHDKDGLVCPAKLRRLRVHGADARVLGSWVDNKANDFAILLVDHHFKEVVPIGLPPQAGDTITIYGYDYAVTKDPQLSTRTGKLVKVQHGEMSDVNFTSAVGVSGGPAIDTSGNLAGILVWSSSIMPNIGFRQSIKQLLRDADLPPPNAAATKPKDVPPPPKDVPPPPPPPPPPKASKSAELIAAEKETEALKAALERASVKLAEKAATPPPPKETVAESPKEGETTAGKIATGVSKTLDAADSLATNPWIIAGITLLTGGAGAGGLKAFQVFSAARKLRKKLHPLPSDQPGTEVPDPDSFQGAERQLHTRDETEARELLRLRQLEGRSPLLDSFVGVAFQDFVKNDLDGQSMPDEQKRYVRDLWSRINERVESAAPINTGSEHSQDWRTK